MFDALQGVDGYGYTHSYGNRQSPPNCSMNGMYWARLAQRIGAGGWTNRALNGGAMAQITARARGLDAPSIPAWTPGSRGLAVVMGTANDVLSGVSQLHLDGFRNPLASLLHILSADLLVESSAFALTGAWASGSSGTATTRYTTSSSASASVSFTGTGATVLLIGWAFGFVPGATVVVKVDGKTVATVDTNAAVRDIDARKFSQIPVSVTGLPYGPHTLTVSSASPEGSYMGIDSLLIPSPTPPTIVVCKDPLLSPASWTWPNYSVSGHAQYNGVIDSVCAAFPNAIVVDNNRDWVSSTMFASDGIHPNDRGMSKIADNIAAELTALDFRPGLNY